jgi:acyl-coenzyme A thioesterase PaaI-like protein|tara:strand:+ start:164 stop:628 length:465 start_codon:yes stop_codon:yes gene_type:complete
MEVSLGKMRWLLFLLGFVRIPMIAYVRPKLLSIDENSVRVRIRLRRKTKNHLNSMYFGALAVGADIAGGIQVFYFSKAMDQKVSFAFKGMNAQFLKRAESDIIFESTEGQKIKAAMEQSLSEGSRINDSIMVEAKNSSGELVATFEMIISVRVS